MDQYEALACEMKEFTSAKKEVQMERAESAPGSPTPTVVHLNVSNSITNPIYSTGGPSSLPSVSPRGPIAPAFESNSLGKHFVKLNPDVKN